MFLDTPYHVVSGFKAYACFFVINCHSTNYFLFFNFNVKKFPPRSLELAIFVGIFEGGIEGGRVNAAEAGYAEVTPPAGLIKR